MSDEVKEAVREYLKENLRVEVFDPTVIRYEFAGRPCYIYQYDPTVRVRLMLEGEVLSEDDVALYHHHGEDR